MVNLTLPMASSSEAARRSARRQMGGSDALGWSVGCSVASLSFLSMCRSVWHIRVSALRAMQATWRRPLTCRPRRTAGSRGAGTYRLASIVESQEEDFGVLVHEACVRSARAGRGRTERAGRARRERERVAAP